MHVAVNITINKRDPDIAKKAIQWLKEVVTSPEIKE